MLEPLLNGNEIMSETKLAPGPLVGVIRDALLQAQIAGEVTDRASALHFVCEYARKSVARRLPHPAAPNGTAPTRP